MPGGRDAATLARSHELKAASRCERSQNGFVREAPHRQSATGRPGSTSNRLPSTSTMSTGPVTLYGPSSRTLMTTRSSSTADLVPGNGNVPVAGADGWRCKPFEHDEAHNLHGITLVREEDGADVALAMPDVVEQGDELRGIALLVIRARQRRRELKGLGA